MEEQDSANEEGSYSGVPAVSYFGREYLGNFDVKITKSSTIGCKKRDRYDSEHNRTSARNWLGTGKHRIHVVCPECSQLIPAGRIAQHYGYKHGDKPMLTRY